MSLNIHILTLGKDEDGNVDIRRITELFNKGFPPIGRIHVIHTAEKDPSEANVSGVPVRFWRQEEIFDFLKTMEIVINIYKRTKDAAEYWINITGGTKPMTIGAHLGATYIGARAYYIPQGAKDYLEITQPRIPPLELSPNQMEIIRILESDRMKKLNKQYLEPGMSQTILTKNLVISGQATNYNCLRLQKSGYLQIKDDPEDGRKKICTLTNQGIMASKLV